MESEPWGFESDNAFVNVGMMIDCDLHPESLLSVLLEIERGVGGGASHRDASGGYADRLLDIDLIDYGRMVYVGQPAHAASSPCCRTALCDGASA